MSMCKELAGLGPFSIPCHRPSLLHQDSMGDTEVKHSRADVADAQERIKEIAAGVFQVDVASIDIAMGPDDVAGWDSLAHLRLVTEVEAAFSQRLTMDQIQEARSLADIARFVTA
jgi:acyl carrier protein